MAGELNNPMKSKGFFPVFLTAVVAGSFAIGLFEPEVRARGGLPELFSSLRPGSAGRELDPINTYNRTLQVVRDRFYGDVPSNTKMTYTAIKGMLNALDDPYTRFLAPEE